MLYNYLLRTFPYGRSGSRYQSWNIPNSPAIDTNTCSSRVDEPQKNIWAKKMSNFTLVGGNGGRWEGQSRTLSQHRGEFGFGAPP